MKSDNPVEILVSEFLRKANSLSANCELIKVLKARIFQIADANILIRGASTSTSGGRYFFGINYITIEELANLNNPFMAFICDSIENTLIMPAQVIFKNLSNISHDRNGEYKIIIDSDLNIVLKGRGNILDCQLFNNAWDLLLAPPKLHKKFSVEESLHSIIQGRLIEIGNIRGYYTFCPNKNKLFNGKKLAEISTIKRCPVLEFAEFDTLRQIDVLWFRERNQKLLPVNAFEVEISTGTWSGVGRMATLIDYPDVNLYVISDDPKKYNQVISSFYDYRDRYKNISTNILGDLYTAELKLKELRYEIGL